MNDLEPVTVQEVAERVRKVKVRNGSATYELDLDLVERLAAQGVEPAQIAAIFGMTLDELRRKRRVSDLLERSLAAGKAKGIAKVAGRLFHNAVNNDNVIAQIFWLKSRAGWREADKLPQTDESSNNVVVHLPHNSRD